MTDCSLVNSSNFRWSLYSRKLRKVIQQYSFMFQLNTVCCAVSAWKTKLAESAKGKSQPEIQLQSINLFPFDLQILSSVDNWLFKKGVIQNGTLAQAEPCSAVDLLNLKCQLLFHVSCVLPGGFSSNCMTKDWFIEVLRSCLFQLHATLHCQTLSPIRITRWVSIHVHYMLQSVFSIVLTLDLEN